MGGMGTRTVLIVLFEGVQSLDLTGPLEVFSTANRLRGERGYAVTTAAPGGRPVHTSSGLLVTPDEDLGRARVTDLLLVPGGEGTRDPDPDVVGWLRRHAGEARQVVSVCTGAFLLAEAGLLNGHRATTHWAYCGTLAGRYPDVEVDAEPIFVRDGRVATSAGVTAGIDLALALVEEDFGRELALRVARQLVVFLRRPGGQAQFSVQLATQTASSEPLQGIQQWITEHPGDDLTVDALARRVNLSPRHFARAFTAEVGMSPGRYVDRVRLEAARRQLEDTTDGVMHIAHRCGFGTPEAMRRAFLRTLGVGPAEYRRRFQSGLRRERDADRHPVV